MTGKSHGVSTPPPEVFVLFSAKLSFVLLVVYVNNSCHFIQVWLGALPLLQASIERCSPCRTFPRQIIIMAEDSCSPSTHIHICILRIYVSTDISIYVCILFYVTMKNIYVFNLGQESTCACEGPPPSCTDLNKESSRSIAYSKWHERSLLSVVVLLVEDCVCGGDGVVS